MIAYSDEQALSVSDTAEVFRSSRILTHPVCPIQGSGNRATKPDRYKTVVSISHTVEASCGRQRIAPIPLVQLIGGHAEGQMEHRQTCRQNFGRQGHSQTTPLHIVIRLNRFVVAIRSCARKGMSLLDNESGPFLSKPKLHPDRCTPVGARLL